MAGQGIKFVVQIGSLVILARLLTPQDYGLMAMAWVVVSAAEVVRDFGLSAAAVQAKELSQAQRDNLFWINLTVGTALTVVVLITADLIGRAYGQPELATVTRGMAVIFLLNGAATQYRASLNRALRFTAVAVSDTASVIAGLVAAVALAFAGAGFWALVGQQLVQSLVALVLLIGYGRWLPGRPRRHAQMRALVTFGANEMVAQLINYFSRNIDTVLVGVRFGLTELGFYSRAYSLVRLPINQISNPAANVALPVLSRLQDDPARFRVYVLRGQSVLVHLMALLFGFLAAQADPIVALTLGSQWSPIVPFLVILAVGGVFEVASSAAQWVITARGRAGSYLRLMLFTRTLMIGLIVLGSVWGTIGVAVAYSLSCVLICVVAILWAGRVAGAPAGALLGNIATVVLGYATCSVASYAVSLAVPTEDDLLRIAVGAAVMALSLGVLCWCWARFRRDLTDAVGVLGLVFPGRRSRRKSVTESWTAR